MISFLKGKIIVKKEKFVVLDVGGVGFRVFFSKKNMAHLSEGRDMELFTFLDVKENSLNLYGFLTSEELEFFEILDSIRGVGPKAALEISSIGSLEKIKERIMRNDEKLFEGIPGIGRKKANAIMLELSGKIRQFPKKEKVEIGSENEEALVNLGFSRQKAKEALSRVSKNIKSNEEKIKQALKILGKQ